MKLTQQTVADVTHYTKPERECPHHQRDYHQRSGLFQELKRHASSDKGDKSQNRPNDYG